ncbi:hypothetical protein [Halomarina litorea]|uniref:hypothetical protein n=1 Tax=Halomarina litorea TaxID=2961595 RepID=UPI0020C47E60|nr:hypothetical protein [Halomarina sp. BCD28]
MSNTAPTIESREALHEQFIALIDAAERGSVDVEGGYDVETTEGGNLYDVEVIAVSPNRD